MGQEIRQQIYKSIETLERTVYVMEQLENVTDTEMIYQLLRECCELAIAIRSKVLHIYNEELYIINSLEVFVNYCEAILAKTPKESAMSEMLKKMQDQINGIKTHSRVELKKEIVFLPYKASMWDSLESVWKAACEDGSCVVRVVPIPYFDKNPDGSFATMHWEGAQFPDYVPITKYEDYDLQEHSPDMIFIHNPYDEYNVVTSVHPDYYSSRIKDFTDKLVYIPYFILDEIKPFDMTRVNQKKHFCLTAAVFNADYVVVQSEDMRQIYINVLSESAGEHTRAIWEKKILGLGSPKVDKALEVNKANVKIPQDWLNVIRKEDGSWKKIVFYNISLGALLLHGVKMLDKIESVLSFFYEHTDELVLLWRPHPLYLSTIESMAPDLKERYIKMVENYINEGWGIYDDTSDMDRAIAISDIYYGDGSSVARLYEKTNKKIMFQNPGIK